jgi:outer membrane protein, heavy metal efflux system
MWDHVSHRLMVGLTINLPLARARRAAGVDLADARLRRARAERDHLATEIAAEVVALVRRVQESGHVVAHYREQILPASRDRVDAAHAAFLAGNLPFFAVVDALRSLRNHELEYEEHLATLYQRLAALDRSLGRIPGLETEPGSFEEMDHGH